MRILDLLGPLGPRRTLDLNPLDLDPFDFEFLDLLDLDLLSLLDPLDLASLHPELLKIQRLGPGLHGLDLFFLDGKRCEALLPYKTHPVG